MKRWRITGTVCAMALLCAAGAHAQSDPSLSAHRTTTPVAAAPSGGDFGDLVDQDVASGYYSRAEGDALKGKFEVAQEHIQASFAKAEAQIGKDTSLFASSDQQQTMKNQLLGIDVNAQGKVGSTPEDIQRDAEAMYTTADRSIQLQRIAITNAQPVIQDAVDEMDRLVAERSRMIANSPNAPSSVKHDVNSQAAKIHTYAEGGVQRSMDAELAKIADAQDRFESNKGKFIEQTKQVIQDRLDKYGDDPTKWPKSDSAPQQETQNTPPPKELPAKQEGPAPPETPVPPPPPPKPPKRGVVPNDQPDPAFNAHRNDPTDEPTDDGGGIKSGVDSASDAASRLSAKGKGTGEPKPPSDPIDDYLNNPKKALPPQVYGSGTTGDQPKLNTESAGGKNPLDDRGRASTPGQGSSASAGNAAGAAFNGAKEGTDGTGDGSPEAEVFNANRAGRIHLVDGDQYGPNLPQITLPRLQLPANELQSIEYGDTITTVSLLPIYAGYRLSDHTGDAMMSLDLHPLTPSSVMTVPSTQVLTPSFVGPMQQQDAGWGISSILCGR